MLQEVFEIEMNIEECPVVFFGEQEPMHHYHLSSIRCPKDSDDSRE